VITAVTLNSSTSYFQYKMQPMGYEYDLIADFASDGMVSMGDILSHFSTFPACGSEVYRMLANRGLFFDLEGPLSADTLIWRKND